MPRFGNTTRSAFGLIAGGILAGTAGAASSADVPLIPRDVLFGNPERANVLISPDGTKLSYLAPLNGVLNVWVMPVGGTEARPVTRSVDRPVRSYQWAYNNEQVIYTQDRNGDENRHVYAVSIADGREIDLTPHDGIAGRIVLADRERPDEILVAMNNRIPQLHDVHVVNTRTGASSLVFQNDEGWIGFQAAPDFSIRLVSRITPDGGLQALFRTSPDGAWQPLATWSMEDQMTSGPAGFTRNFDTIYTLDSRGRDTGALLAHPVTEDGLGEAQLIAEDHRADVSDAMADPATGRVQAVAFEWQKTRWQVFDAAIARDIEALGHVADGDMEVVSRSLDDKTWVTVFHGDTEPVTYYLWDRDAQEATRLFSARPALDAYTLAPMKPITYNARDGLEIVGYLTVPAQSTGKDLPMVLFVHGGPWARSSWGYNPYHQWLANRGYAVLDVNFRGSTGFGKNFVNAGNREWAHAMQDDLTDAVAWAVDKGIADPDRVGIMGGSYGGYATLVGMTFTPEMYACGVDIVGPSHVRTLLETIPPYWQPMIEMFETRVGSLEESEWLDSISPLTKVDQIRRPLLIGQGANDPRVKVSESDQIVAEMERRNLPVTYVVFPDEGHGFAKPENNMAFNAITETFLAKHLGGRSEPVSGAVEMSSADIRAGAELILDPAGQP